jgi:hypothetical protein
MAYAVSKDKNGKYSVVNSETYSTVAGPYSDKETAELRLQEIQEDDSKESKRHTKESGTESGKQSQKKQLKEVFGD